MLLKSQLRKKLKHKAVTRYCVPYSDGYNIKTQSSKRFYACQGVRNDIMQICLLKTK